jgi:hypothetical protein
VTSRAESVISSSGVSDSETASQSVAATISQGNFSAILLPPMLDVAPPRNGSMEKEVVTYSKEVQTTTWIPEESSDDEEEEVVKRRVEEEVRMKLERIRMEELREREMESQRLEAEKEVPGKFLMN